MVTEKSLPGECKDLSLGFWVEQLFTGIWILKKILPQKHALLFNLRTHGGPVFKGLNVIVENQFLYEKKMNAIFTGINISDTVEKTGIAYC